MSGLPNDMTKLTCDDDHCILIWKNFFFLLGLRRCYCQIYLSFFVFSTKLQLYSLMLRLDIWLKSNDLRKM